MYRKILLTILLAPFVATLWGTEPIATQYYKVYPTGVGCYKIEAIRQMITPQMQATAATYSTDPRVQELITMAQGLDLLTFEGLRLVRERGVLVNDGPVDEAAIARATYYFNNLTPTQAKAWLVTSRLMQISKFTNDGVALAAVEQEMVETAVDLGRHLKTYFGENAWLGFMPHFARVWYVCEGEIPLPRLLVVAYQDDKDKGGQSLQ